MNHSIRSACALLALIVASAAGADEWRLLDESEFLFEASWEDTALPGRFDSFDVQIDLGSGIGESRITVTVDLGAADMNDPDINDAIAGPDWFDVDSHPQASWASSSVTETGPGQYVASGELFLKGIRKAVEVPFTWSESDDRAEMSGQLALDRTRFGIGSGEWASDDSIGTRVSVTFTLHFVRR